MAPRIAVVAYQGVLADESHAFRDVFRRVPGAEVLTVGEEIGVVAGPGGAQVVTTTFRTIGHVDVIVVPGGLGSHHHNEIGWWIMASEPAWVVTSSTGSALLAASGLLRNRTAATHWLAGPLLERHGVVVSRQRIAVDPPYITCSGSTTTRDAALARRRTPRRPGSRRRRALLARHRAGDRGAGVRGAVPLSTPPRPPGPAPVRDGWHPTPADRRRRAATPGRIVEIDLDER